MLRTVLLLLAVSGCAAIPAAPPTIPSMPAERVPRPPASTVTLIWQPGHFQWDGRAYQWIPGEWVPRAGRRLWQDGIWRRGPTGWVWEPAHWL